MSLRSPILRLMLGLLFVAVPRLSAEDLCLSCHGKALAAKPGTKAAPLFPKEAFAKSPHASLSCTSCHADLEEKDHPGKPVDKVSCTQCHAAATKSFDHSVHGVARKAGKTNAPGCIECHGDHDVLAMRSADSPVARQNLSKTCGACHGQIVSDVEKSAHGQAMAKGIKEAPSCVDCHAGHQLESLHKASPLKVAQDVCASCHGSERFNSRFNLSTNRVTTFFNSYHGLAAKAGDGRTANCASCHGYHNILNSSDPKSPLHPTNRLATCAKCHPGATDLFTQGRIHSDGTETETRGDRINTWVRRIYLFLIFLTIGGMAAHNLAALWKKARKSLKDQDRTVVRMNLGARLQHGFLATSFIYLVISGFALVYPGSWLNWFVIGGEAGRRMGHRIAAVIMLVLSVIHLVYLVGTQDGRRFLRDMMPAKHDFTDLFQNLRYLFVSKGKRPKFHRFGYAEKAEYWAVVWGTIIMGATGLLLWFKVYATHWMPRWIVDIATTIHLYEAILATLAILVWHFYFVMFDPDIYPINWAWFDGKITREHHEEEHPLDRYEAAGGPADE